MIPEFGFGVTRVDDIPHDLGLEAQLVDRNVFVALFLLLKVMTTLHTFQILKKRIIYFIYHISPYILLISPYRNSNHKDQFPPVQKLSPCTVGFDERTLLWFFMFPSRFLFRYSFSFFMFSMCSLSYFSSLSILSCSCFI